MTATEIRGKARTGARPLKSVKGRRRKSRLSGLWPLALIGAALIGAGLGAGALAALMLDGRAQEIPAVQPATPAPSAEAPARGGNPPPISPDAPWIRNAAPFPAADPRPRLAVILVDEGRDPALSAAAQRLSEPLNLALAAHVENLKERVAGARRSGHEVLIALPFDTEPPGVFAGGALMANLPEAENLRRLRWRLGQAPEAVGVLGVGGEIATRNRAMMDSVMGEIRNAGALFVDSRAHPESQAGAAARRMGAPAGDAALRIDESADVEAIMDRLSEAEGRATVWGATIAMGALSPQTLEAFRRWTAERGPSAEAPVALAPISAVIKRLRSGSSEPNGAAPSP